MPGDILGVCYFVVQESAFLAGNKIIIPATNNHLRSLNTDGLVHEILETKEGFLFILVTAS